MTTNYHLYTPLIILIFICSSNRSFIIVRVSAMLCSRNNLIGYHTGKVVFHKTFQNSVRGYQVLCTRFWILITSMCERSLSSIWTCNCRPTLYEYESVKIYFVHALVHSSFLSLMALVNPCIVVRLCFCVGAVVHHKLHHSYEVAALHMQFLPAIRLFQEIRFVYQRTRFLRTYEKMCEELQLPVKINLPIQMALKSQINRMRVLECSNT